MKELKRKFTLRTALLTALTVTLNTSAAVFIAVSAAENVTPSDVSPTSATGDHTARQNPSVPQNVSPSDVSPTSATEDHTARQNPSVPQNVSPSDVSPSDLPDEDALPDGTETVRGHLVLPRTFDNVPENLGEPVITMTTAKAVGERLAVSYYDQLFVDGKNIYIDYGDGMPVEFPGDRTVKGSNIKIYGDNITSLYCYNNQLTALDVSKNTALKELWCYRNQLTALDVSKNTDLTVLYCGENQLTALDVSKNTALKELWCYRNQLTALDVSKNTALTELSCDCNQLTALDVSKNTALTVLECDSNQLTALDVSKNTALTKLYCYGNQLTALDVSKNTALEVLWCNDIELPTLDVSKNTALKELWCCGNQLTALDVSKNTALAVLYCGENQLTALDVSKNTALTELSCDCNQLTALDVSKNTALTVLECDSNQLTALDVSKNTALEVLWCNDIELPTLDVSKNTALKELWCCGNQLTALDVSKNTALAVLYCGENQLTALDVSKNTALTELSCDCNQLTALDVSKNTALTVLECDSNQLTALDVSKNTALWVLECDSNQLTALDVSKNTALRALRCNYNQLTMPQIESITKTIQWGVWYAPQTHVIPSTVKVGDAIDLSSEYSVDGTVTQYTWYDGDGNVVVPATANGGVFTFGEDAVGKKLVCKMTNANLPKFKTETGSYEEYDDDGNPTGNLIDYESDNRLTTTEVEIKAAETEETADNSIPVNDNGFVKEAEHSDDATVAVNGEEIRINDVRLVVNAIASEAQNAVLNAVQKYAAALSVTDDNAVIYDISLVDGNGSIVTVTKGKIKIHLKYPDTLSKPWTSYTFHLFHQKDDGSIEEIPIVCQSDGIWFETDNFSPYALVWNEKTSGGSNVDTGESAAVIWVMAALFVLSLAGVGFVAYRRRKQTAA